MVFTEVMNGNVRLRSTQQYFELGRLLLNSSTKPHTVLEKLSEDGALVFCRPEKNADEGVYWKDVNGH